MKKLLTILFVFVAIASNAQLKGYSVEAIDYFVLNGDTAKQTTQVDVNDTTLATKQYVLNTAGAGNGWDSLTWNPSTGQIVWWYAGAKIDSINTDNRYVELADSTTQYLTPDSINNLISSAGTQVAYTIVLPSAATVAGRITGTISVPSGWTLTDDGSDLVITHSLGRRVASVDVTYVVSGTQDRHLVNFNNAYTGLVSADSNNLTIENLTTIQREINIYILFAQ